MQWTLDQLRQFVTAADAGSISAAARTMGRAQSAVSAAIALLEADMGVPLFDRSRRNARLTDAGKLLLLEAREVLRQAEALSERAVALSAGSPGRFSLALDEALPSSATATLIREMSSRFPELELTLLTGSATEIAGYISLGRADAGLHFDRGAVAANLDQRHIGTVPQGVYVARGHPLDTGRAAERSDLVRHRQLVLYADDRDDSSVYSPRVWRVDSYYGIAEMVADELGWAILPVNIARDENYPMHLRQVPCPSLALPLLSVRMIWRQGWPPTRSSQWIERRFAELLRAGMG